MIAGPVACFTFDHLDEGTGDLLDLLDRKGVRASFFVEGRHGEERPEAVAGIVGRGHELGMHGWAHEQWDRLAPDEEQRLAARATSALEAAGGERPVGFRAPGGARTPRTAALLCQRWVAKGFLETTDPAKKSRRYKLGDPYAAIVDAID